MTSRRALVASIVAGAIAIASLGLVAPAAAVAPHPLATAIQDSTLLHTGPDGELAMQRAALAGATRVKVDISWHEVAPKGDQRPAGFDAANPADPRYDWNHIDVAVRRAVASGLEPFISVSEAPAWAERPAGGRSGTNNPSPGELAAFFQAAARRFSGSFAGLPRVRAWEIWNEVNASFFFMPQQDGSGNDLSPALYRAMINAVADAVHGVHADNVVVAGATFPFVVSRPPVHAIGAARFLRGVLCLSPKLRPIRGCGEPAKFDAWSHHPYTPGRPSLPVANPDSVSIAQLPVLARILRAGARHGRIRSSRRAELWVTEWGWDSSPSDPRGVPAALHARWVSESLYVMWRSGVTVATWFFLRDGAGRDSRFQSGLYLRCAQGVACDTPKLSLDSFRFPFVAMRERKRLVVWGRTPSGQTAKVIVERAAGAGWKRVATLKTDRYGVFTRKLRKPRRGTFRARLGGGTSLPFAVKKTPNFPISPPIG